MLIAIIPRAMPWARSFLGFQPASTDTKVPAKRCILLFTMQKACYTRSVCLSPAKRLFIVVNVVFCCFPSSARRQGRGRGDERFFLSCGEFPLVGAVGGWPVGSPGASPSPWWQGQRLAQPWRQADVAARAVTRRRRSAARWAVRPCRTAPWVSRPACRHPGLRRYPGLRRPWWPS